MEDTRKWGIVVLVIVTILSLLFGILANVRVAQFEQKLKEERQKRTAVELQLREKDRLCKDLQEKVAFLKEESFRIKEEDKKLRKSLSSAKKELSKCKHEMEKLIRLKETLEENLKNALMAVPQGKNKEITSGVVENKEKENVSTPQ